MSAGPYCSVPICSRNKNRSAAAELQQTEIRTELSASVPAEVVTRKLKYNSQEFRKQPSSTGPVLEAESCTRKQKKQKRVALYQLPCTSPYQLCFYTIKTA
jgi:hypothetical protein